MIIRKPREPAVTYFIRNEKNGKLTYVHRNRMKPIPRGYIGKETDMHFVERDLEVEPDVNLVVPRVEPAAIVRPEMQRPIPIIAEHEGIEDIARLFPENIDAPKQNANLVPPDVFPRLRDRRNIRPPNRLIDETSKDFYQKMQIKKKK